MTDPNAQRAVCCGPVCKRPPSDCVAAIYGAGIIERAKAAALSWCGITKQ